MFLPASRAATVQYDIQLPQLSSKSPTNHMSNGSKKSLCESHDLWPGSRGSCILVLYTISQNSPSTLTEQHNENHRTHGPGSQDCNTLGRLSKKQSPELLPTRCCHSKREKTEALGRHGGLVYGAFDPPIPAVLVITIIGVILTRTP